MFSYFLTMLNHLSLPFQDDRGWPIALLETRWRQTQTLDFEM